MGTLSLSVLEKAPKTIEQKNILQSRDDSANASLGYRLELADPAYFVYGKAQSQEQTDVTVQLLGKEAQSPSVSVCFRKNIEGWSLEESVSQLVEPQRALGFEAEIETGVVLGDGNTYTKAALTNDGMHIDYWVRLAGDTIVYDMAIYSESDKGLVDTAMAAVKPY